MSRTNERKAQGETRPIKNQVHNVQGRSKATRPNTRHASGQAPRRAEPTYRARPATPLRSSPPPANQTRPVAATASASVSSSASAASLATAHALTDQRRRRLRLLLVAFLGIVALAVGGAFYFFSAEVIDPFSKIFVTPVSRRPFGTPLSTIVRPEGSPVAGADGTQEPGNSVISVPVYPTHVYPTWGKQPVNILLLGLDYRPLEEDTRADTQILVHIDPVAKTVTMISFPRDLYVDVPGYGMGRINSAYQKGDHDERKRPGSVPGGGPGLAMATIEENFGPAFSPDYFAQVDFKGFEDVVDTLGGVTLDVLKPLVDNDYPLAANSYGSTRIYIPAGLQHLDGHTALQYARSRHADSDLGRNTRQQQVLLALRQQGLNLNLIPRLPTIASQLSGAVRTDLSLSQLGSLAQLAREIKAENIATCRIDADMIYETFTPTGEDVLMPRWDIIRPRLARCMSDPRLTREAARLSVKNGTYTGGTGTKVSKLLAAQGLEIADLSSASDQGTHPVTTITDYTGGQKPRTIEVIAKTLGIDQSEVLKGDPVDAPVSNNDGKPVDILVMVGDDRITGK